MQTFAHEALARSHGGALAAIIVLSALGALVMCLLVLRFGFPAPGDEPAEQGPRRLLLTRLGHAFAAACFAVSAMLAVVVLAERAPARAAVAPPPDPLAARTADRVRALEATLDTLARRVDAAEAAAARADAHADHVDATVQALGDDVTRSAARVKRREERSVATRATPAAPRQATPPAARAAAPAPKTPRAAAVTPAATAPATATAAGARPAATTSATPAPRATPPPSAAPVVAPAPPFPEAAAAASPAPASDAPALPAADVTRSSPLARAGGAPRATASSGVTVAPPARPARDPAPADLGGTVRHDWEHIKQGFRNAGRELRDALDDTGRRLRERFE